MQPKKKHETVQGEKAPDNDQESEHMPYNNLCSIGLLNPSGNEVFQSSSSHYRPDLWFMSLEMHI